MRVLLLALASLAFAGGRARAQVCPCNTAQPFGSCPVDVVFPNFPGGPYPDQFPGSVTIVERSGGTVEAYIADYFSGRTHRFSYDTALSSAKYEGSINSPGGSATTTGITARAGEEGTDLFWAVADRLLRSDVDGNNADEVATVNMEELASQLRVDLEDESIPVGRLGDIVYHPVRETFWGVDLTNDVYFEFDESGNLVFEEGEPNYFLNPMRRSAVAGAYGNSITYVRAGDADYFDIPVGALAAGRPTRVMRVHASEGDDHGFGDDTGVFYPIGANLLSVGFPTGIGYWPDYCGDGQHAEILPHVYAANDTLPVVFFTSADEPASASIAAFAAAASGPNEITLSWRKTLPYTSVQFRLQTLDGSGSQPALVGELSDFENDPEMLEIPGVAPGSYEATAVVASGAEAWPPLASRVTVGRGVQVAVARLTPPEDAELSAPGGATALPEGRILVADAAGSAELFDLELSSRGRLPSPAPEGTVTGVAYRAVDDRIYWLQQDGGAAYLHKTDVEGETEGLRLLVDTPANLVQVPTLVGLAYDAAADAFWTVDTLNQVVYAIEADGAVADAFTSAQLPAPDDSLVLGGAVGLSASDATNSVIDLATGTKIGRAHV